MSYQNLVSAPIAWAAKTIDGGLDYASAVFSGIAPDDAHKKRGGYHCSVSCLIAFGNGDDYSNTRPDDRGFNPNYCAAIDMSMSLADMKKAYGRIRAVFNDRTDPRRQYINAINCYDGTGDAERLDFVTNTITRASEDHKWHCHSEIRRKFLLLMKAAQALVSIFTGDSKAKWIEDHPEDAPSKPDGRGWTEIMVDNLPTLQKGSKGEHVDTWQHTLCARGFVPKGDWDTFCDGVFGSGTEAKTIALQSKYGLKKDGVVGKSTWATGLLNKKS